jgi:hypothetical protein
VRLFAAIAAFALLTGCGSDSGSERHASREQEQAAPAHPEAERPADTRPVIAAFGDSLTAGFGAEPGKSYPDYLQQLLDRAGYRYRVVNLGISGDTTNGGVETVTANDPHDQVQISLIQQHLMRERELFAAGNFTDPMAIHGMNMPGIQDLQKAATAGRVSITYAALSNGASLTYATNDADLIDTLHTWFDAQVMDHGSHAMG